MGNMRGDVRVFGHAPGNIARANGRNGGKAFSYPCSNGDDIAWEVAVAMAGGVSRAVIGFSKNPF
jgi:hypothetical protein